uniref:Uncharacterized protein n=1 Tax=Arundo donax TaxID=35708 RepID=A0A0A9CCG0_ARUDO
MSPDSLLSPNDKNMRPCSLPSPAGKGPENSLKPMLALDSNVQLAMLAGIGPQRELP